MEGRVNTSVDVLIRILIVLCVRNAVREHVCSEVCAGRAVVVWFEHLQRALVEGRPALTAHDVCAEMCSYVN